MGTRVLIICTDGQTVSTAIYQHYDGYDAPKIIAAAKAMTYGRKVCPDRAAAVITAAAVGYFVESARQADAVLGPSAYREAPPVYFETVAKELNRAILAMYRQGLSAHASIRAKRALTCLASDYGLDAGLVVVDVRKAEWAWRAFAGDLERHEQCGRASGAAA